MSKHLNKTTAEKPQKKVGKSEPYEGSELQKRVHGAIQKGEKRKEEQAKKEEIERQKEEALSDLLGKHGVWKQLKAAQIKVQAEKNEKISGQLEEAKHHIHRNTPPSVKAVFELIEALNSFEGEIGLGTDKARLLAAAQLGEQLAALAQATNGNPEKKRYQQILGQFEEACSEIMKVNYKRLAAEPTLWNYIKDKFNSAMKWIHLAPRGLVLDTTLDSSALIKDEKVQAKFKEILNTNVKIEHEPDVDTPLRGPTK
ncbi:hypothetical protein FOLKNPGA_02605 [Legionella sp. PC1000]|uniref:hypothetical protein n=1 Tax=Legionella sp. PC1000 TaxID=2746060 RepID=UPI0015FACA0E|nr:hypothetical protein [Legionella sp. PC1000]QLZ69806.1 hypothetical protein FOLKNPGA_02605 [Legionella sp. PC1000]